MLTNPDETIQGVRSILLVEDEPLLAMNYKRLLEHDGYQVSAFNDAVSALDFFRAEPDSFNLVLMDIDLGGNIDGPTAAHQMLSTRDIPIVFLSAHTESDFTDRTLSLRSYGFISKTAGTSVMLASVRMAFRLWESHTQKEANERQYRILVDNLPDLIIRFDRTFHILYTSPLVHLISASEPEKLVGQSLIALGLPDRIRDDWENAVDNVFLSGFSYERDFHFFGPKGHVDIDWRAVPELEANGQISSVLCIVRDISSERLAENYRAQNEYRMAFLLDLHSRSASLSIPEICERTLQMSCELSLSSVGLIAMRGLMGAFEAKPTIMEFAKPADPRSREVLLNSAILDECVKTRAITVGIVGEEQPRPESRYWILVPVLDHDKVAMVLELADRPGPYVEDGTNQLQLIANEVYRIINRHQTEDAMQENSRQYQSILNAASDGFFIMDENGAFQDANEVFLRVTGYRLPEVLKLNLSDLEMNRGIGDFEGLIRNAIARGTYRFETGIKRKDGVAEEVEISTSHISSSHRFVCFVRQIGEQKKIDAEMLRMQHLLSETGRIAHIGGWEYDLESQRVSWTDEVFRIHEVGLGFVPTLDRVRGFIEDETRDRFEVALQEAMENLRPFSIDLRIRTATGRYKWVHTNGRPVVQQDILAALTGTYQDITDQKETANKAQESSRQFDQFFALSADMLAIMDADGHFIRTNTAWATTMAFHGTELIGKRFIDYVHPEHVPESLKAFQKARHEKVSRFTNRLRGGDGAYRWIEWQAAPDGNLVYTVARDVTEKKRKDEALRLQFDLSMSMLELYQRSFANEHELLEFALESAVRLTSSAFGFLHVVSKDQDEIGGSYWSSAVRELSVSGEKNHSRISEAGIWAEGARTRHTTIVNDYQHLSEKRGYPADHPHIIRYLGVPIFEDSKLCIIAGMANKDDPYSETDAKQCELFMSSVWRLVFQQRLTGIKLTST